VEIRTFRALKPWRLLPIIHPMEQTIVLMELVFAITLMRALLVAARVLPPSCARCGVQLERRALGERICRCGQ
jgi:hypothetical protein